MQCDFQSRFLLMGFQRVVLTPPSTLSSLCVRKGWSSPTNCKRANFLLLICKHVVKALIGGYVGASSVAEADFGPYGNLGQIVKAVIALNVNDEKISHGSQLLDRTPFRPDR